MVFPYSEGLAAYDLGPEHPLRPARFTLAVELMRDYGLLDDPRTRVVAPEPVDRATLQLVHSSSYVDVVMDAGREPHAFHPRHGIGPGDTPAFHGMHDAASLICGATAHALLSALEGNERASFSVAGGLHHAHRDRAAGFCVYNDIAVAIAALRRDHPGVRVAYVDIDAHHGDGVEEAFYDTPDVLTISVHESGRYLFPGTGRIVDTGTGPGAGAAINVPLPPLADDVCYSLVLHQVIQPALAAFQPDIVIAQCGADAHHADPLTHLGLTLGGHRALVSGLLESAEAVCDGRICCTGGGGYGSFSAVPQAFAAVMATLLGLEPPDALPERWRRISSQLSGQPAPARRSQDVYEPIPAVTERVRVETAALVDRVKAASQLLTSA